MNSTYFLVASVIPAIVSIAAAVAARVIRYRESRKSKSGQHHVALFLDGERVEFDATGEESKRLDELIRRHRVSN
jgi:hypothetical protein